MRVELGVRHLSPGFRPSDEREEAHHDALLRGSQIDRVSLLGVLDAVSTRLVSQLHVGQLAGSGPVAVTVFGR